MRLLGAIFRADLRLRLAPGKCRFVDASGLPMDSHCVKPSFLQCHKLVTLTFSEAGYRLAFRVPLLSDGEKHWASLPHASYRG